MGTMSLLLEFTPVNNTPPGAINNPQTFEQWKSPVAVQYAEPQHFVERDQRAPSALAGIWEVNNQYFKAAPPTFPISNTQITTVPERPVDKGTWMALTQGKYQWFAGGDIDLTPDQYFAPGYPDRGVYNQPRQITSAHAVAGAAPSQGIYTGLLQEDIY